MKKESRLIKSFGKTFVGLADIGGKRSNVFISRIYNGEEMGCSYCFPHGHETTNNHWTNKQRNWKKQRKTQWKTK